MNNTKIKELNYKLKRLPASQSISSYNAGWMNLILD